MQHKRRLTDQDLDAVTVQVFNSAGKYTMVASGPDGRDVVIARVEPDAETEVCLRIRLPAPMPDGQRDWLRSALIAAQSGIVGLLKGE